MDENTGWMVGDAGTVFKTQDGGGTWSAIPTGISGVLTEVRFANNREGWAKGASGAVLHSADGGLSWSLVNAPWDTLPRALDLPGSVAVSEDAYYKTQRFTVDGGRTWSPAQAQASAITASGLVWQVKGNKVSRSSVLGGTTLDVLEVGSAYAKPSLLWASNDHVIVATVEPGMDYPQTSGTLWFSTNAGQSWTVVQGPSGDAFDRILRAAPNDKQLLATRWDGMHRSDDGGVTWRKVADRSAVFLGGSALAELLGQDFRLSVDLGETWATQVAPAGVTPRTLRGAGGKALVLGDGQNALWSFNLGKTWSKPDISYLSTEQAQRVSQWMFDAKRGLQLNERGELRQTEDGGRRWKPLLSGLGGSYTAGSPNYQRLQFLNELRGWLLSADGSFYETSNGGASWLTVSTPGGRNKASSFEFMDSQRGWMTSLDAAGQFALTADGGKTWTSITLPTGTNALAWTPAGQLVAYGQLGLLALSADSGKTWSLRYSATLNTFKHLRFASASTAFAVGELGVIVKSMDGGLTWSLVRNGGATLNQVSFASAEQGWAVGDNGTVLSTTDGGRSWSAQKSGATIALNFVQAIDAKSVWITGGGGFVLSTNSGGK